MRRRFSSGFTLIELLVVFAPLAVMLMLAAPSFITFQRNSQLTSAANSFIGSLSAARAEAMKRQLRVFVVPTDRTNWNWANGWQVMVDTDSSVTSGSISFGTNDVEISRQDALPAGVTIDTGTVSGFADGSNKYVMFNGSGFMTLISGTYQTGAIDITNGDETRRVIAAPTGRLRVCKPTDAGCNTTEL
jgi:type IV fimbrial biogenesis protein FimT